MSKKWYPVLDYELCTACGACLRKCTHGVFKDKGGMIVVVKPEGCIEGCHGCEKLCPSKAISYFGDTKGKSKKEDCGCSCDCGGKC
jgi:NAD-dependent dihydropyrimidine dehydrogenase PreA subunit